MITNQKWAFTKIDEEPEWFFVNFGEKLFVPNFKKTFMIQNVAQWE